MSFSSVNLRRIRNFFQKWQITLYKNPQKWQTTIKKATNWWLWYRRTKAADVIDEFVDKHGHDQEMILGSKTTCGEYLDYQRSIVKYHELSATLKDVGRDFGEAANTEYRKEGPIPKRTLSSFFYKTERMAFERDIAADTRMADAELGGGWKGKAMLEGDMFRIEIMAGALGRADADATVERAAAAYEARHDETEKPIDPYEANDKSEL
jgi:hypothetical protein